MFRSLTIDSKTERFNFSVKGRDAKRRWNFLFWARGASRGNFRDVNWIRPCSETSVRTNFIFYTTKSEGGVSWGPVKGLYKRKRKWFSAAGLVKTPLALNFVTNQRVIVIFAESKRIYDIYWKSDCTIRSFCVLFRQVATWLIGTSFHIEHIVLYCTLNTQPHRGTNLLIYVFVICISERVWIIKKRQLLPSVALNCFWRIKYRGLFFWGSPVSTIRTSVTWLCKEVFFHRSCHADVYRNMFSKQIGFHSFT